MQTPTISIILPTFNGQKFLRSAIDSVYYQTYRNWELIIVDDASTDATPEIIKEYEFLDQRIRSIRHNQNRKLPAALNTGLTLAKGNLLTWTSDDNLYKPKALEIMAQALWRDHELDGVFAGATYIDTNGDPIKQVPARPIENIVHENCVGACFLFRHSAFKSVGNYREDLFTAEDYEYWLRFVRKHNLKPLNSNLYFYRQHAGSLTKTRLIQSQEATLKALEENLPQMPWLNSTMWSRAYMRMASLYRALGNSHQAKRHVRKSLKRNPTLIAQFFALEMTLHSYLGPNAAKLARSVFHQWRRLTACLCKSVSDDGCFARFFRAICRYSGGTAIHFFKPPRSNLFMFCPRANIGGAERIHLRIAKCLEDHKPVIILTHDRHEAWLSEFSQYGHIVKLGKWLRNPLTRHLALGYWIACINQTSDSITFGVNTSYYYEMLPLLNKTVRCTDLTHAVIDKFDQELIHASSRLDSRIVISDTVFREFKAWHRILGLDKSLLSRICIIENVIDSPSMALDKQPSPPLRVLHVSRGTPEKRVDLIAKIAFQCKKVEIPSRFRLIGPAPDSVPAQYRESVEIVCPISDWHEMQNEYAKSHVFVLTSDREGSPLTIMEAMANGAIPIAVDVGAIHELIDHGRTGYLIQDGPPEEIISQYVDILQMLTEDSIWLLTLSKNIRSTARKWFSNSAFCQKYRASILGNTISSEA